MKQAMYVSCGGVAHENLNIDHCGVCMKHSWGHLFVCPACDTHPTLRSSKTGVTYLCPVCSRRYATNEATPLPDVTAEAAETTTNSPTTGREDM